MRADLEVFTKVYLKKVDEICHLMLSGLGFRSKEELCRYGIHNQMGTIEHDGNIGHYFFHGIGCEFENNTVEIDWDFGYGPHWCGLDPWKVSKYLEYFNINISWKEIKTEYDKAVLKDEMYIKEDRYYFKD